MMLKQYRETGSKAQRLAMEKYMAVTKCPHCGGRRLNAHARSYRLETSSNAEPFRGNPSWALADLSDLPISDLIEFLSHIAPRRDRTQDRQRGDQRSPLPTRVPARCRA